MASLLSFKVVNAILFFVVLPIVSFMLLNGGVFGLTPVPTEKWGGLLLTLIISVVGITCSIPIGIVLGHAIRWGADASKKP